MSKHTRMTTSRLGFTCVAAIVLGGCLIAAVMAPRDAKMPDLVSAAAGYRTE